MRDRTRSFIFLIALPGFAISCIESPASDRDRALGDAGSEDASIGVTECPDETPWMTRPLREIAAFNGWQADLAVDLDYAYFLGYPLCTVEDPCQARPIVSRLPIAGGVVEVLRESAEWPSAMALGPSDVYVILDPEPHSGVRHLLRIPKTGGEAVEIATDVGELVAADDSFVYYLDSDQTLVRDAADGSPPAPLFSSTEAWGMKSLQVVDGMVYILTTYPTGTVWRVPTGGGDAEQLRVFDDSGFSDLLIAPPRGVVTYAGDDSRDTTIYQFPLAGGDLDVFIDSQESGFAMAADGDFLYWTQWNPGWLRRAPLNGGCVESRTVSEPDSIAVHGEGLVFFADGALEYLAR